MTKKERKHLAAHKRRAQRYFRHVMNFLVKDKEWRIHLHRIDGRSPVKWLAGEKIQCLTGYAHLRWRMILIDPCHDVLATGVHECLHALYWEKTEAEIRSLESLVMRHLSDEDGENLHTALASRFA